MTKQAHPPPSFMGWLRETSWMMKIAMGACVALGAVATGESAFEKLGLSKRLPASVGYVDERIEINNLPIIGGITELQFAASQQRLNEVLDQIDNLEVTKLKTKDPTEIVRINSQLDKKKIERDELRDKIKALKAKSK